MCRGQYQVLLSGQWVNVDQGEAQKLNDACFCIRVEPETSGLEGVSRTPADEVEWDEAFEGCRR